jgi:hypothetical protein
MDPRRSSLLSLSHGRLGEYQAQPEDGDGVDTRLRHTRYDLRDYDARRTLRLRSRSKRCAP